MFQTYLELGYDHISDLAAYDHIVFIIALCAVYTVYQWKEVLILVTAFTIGHSLTLALAALDIIVFNREVIEFLIPLTIFITALYNVARKEHSQKSVRFNYVLAMGFGLIHGMGFSSCFKALLGKEENIFQPLLAFNIGVELGQLMIVAIIMAVGYLGLQIAGIKQKSWNIFISGAAAGIALILMMETKFW